MQKEEKRALTLGQIEEEVLAEGREWMRQRLEQRLQAEADRIGQSFFPSGKKTDPRSKKKAHAAQQRRQG